MGNPQVSLTVYITSLEINAGHCLWKSARFVKCSASYIAEDYKATTPLNIDDVQQ